MPQSAFKPFVCAAASAGLCGGSCQRRAPQADEHLGAERLWDDGHSRCLLCRMGVLLAARVSSQAGLGHHVLTDGSQFSLESVCSSALSLN